MKKLLLLFGFLVAIIALHAQVVIPSPYLPKPSYGFKSKFSPRSFVADTVFFRDYNNLQGLKQPSPQFDNMPVASLGQVNLAYKGNNGQGFDIYSAMPDYMPVLKPDSAFYSAMPNALKYKQMPGQ